MRRPLASKRPIGPFAQFSNSNNTHDIAICKTFKDSKRLTAILEGLLQKSEETGKEVGTFVYLQSLEEEKRWFKTRTVVGEESEVPNELMASALSEVPEQTEKIVVLHTHPSGLPGLSPPDVSLFLDFIDFLDASLVLSNLEGKTILSGVERTKSFEEILEDTNISKAKMEITDITESVLSGEINPMKAKFLSAQVLEDEGIAESCTAVIDDIG